MPRNPYPRILSRDPPLFCHPALESLRFFLHFFYFLCQLRIFFGEFGYFLLGFFFGINDGITGRFVRSHELINLQMQRRGKMNKGLLYDEEREKGYPKNNITYRRVNILGIKSFVGQPEYHRTKGNNERYGIAKHSIYKGCEFFESTFRLSVKISHSHYFR
jgi:hypothetical protein